MHFLSSLRHYCKDVFSLWTCLLRWITDRLTMPKKYKIIYTVLHSTVSLLFLLHGVIVDKYVEQFFSNVVLIVTI